MTGKGWILCRQLGILLSLNLTAWALEPPYLISLAATSDTTVSVTWRNNDITTVGFDILRREGSVAEFDVIATVVAPTITYLDISVTGEHTYVYAVRGFSGNDTSAVSNVDSVETPPRPEPILILKPPRITWARYGYSRDSIKVIFTDESDCEERIVVSRRKGESQYVPMAEFLVEDPTEMGTDTVRFWDPVPETYGPYRIHLYSGTEMVQTNPFMVHTPAKGPVADTIVFTKVGAIPISYGGIICRAGDSLIIRETNAPAGEFTHIDISDPANPLFRGYVDSTAYAGMRFQAGLPSVLPGYRDMVHLEGRRFAAITTTHTGVSLEYVCLIEDRDTGFVVIDRLRLYELNGKFGVDGASIVGSVGDSLVTLFLGDMYTHKVFTLLCQADTLLPLDSRRVNSLGGDVPWYVDKSHGKLFYVDGGGRKLIWHDLSNPPDIVSYGYGGFVWYTGGWPFSPFPYCFWSPLGDSTYCVGHRLEKRRLGALEELSGPASEVGGFLLDSTNSLVFVAAGTYLDIYRYEYGVFTPPWVPLTLWKPAFDEVIHSDSVTLRWAYAGLPAYAYWVEVATDPFFNNVVVSDSNCTDTRRLVEDLSHGTQYWWNVRVEQDSGWSLFSRPKTFTVDTTAVNSVGRNPQSRAHSGDRPACGLQAGRLWVRIAQPARVTLTLFNAKGGTVMKWPQRSLEPGMHEVRMAHGRLPIGAYFLRIHDQKRTDVFRVLVVD